MNNPLQVRAEVQYTPRVAVGEGRLVVAGTLPLERAVAKITSLPMHVVDQKPRNDRSEQCQGRSTAWATGPEAIGPATEVPSKEDQNSENGAEVKDPAQVAQKITGQKITQVADQVLKGSGAGGPQSRS
jgi:hypothetical protein